MNIQTNLPPESDGSSPVIVRLTGSSVRILVAVFAGHSRRLGPASRATGFPPPRRG
jgi:hypothetical protein